MATYLTYIVSLAILLTGCLPGTEQQTAMEELISYLFRSYNKAARPCVSRDCREPLRANFSMSLVSLDLDVKRSTLHTNFFLKIFYEDSRLSWDAAKFGGIKHVVSPQSELWLPDVEIFNPSNGLAGKLYAEHLTANIFSNGLVAFIPVGASSTVCLFNKSESTQTCALKFGSWSYPEHELDLQIYDLDAKPPACDKEFYVGVMRPAEWELSECAVLRTSKEYECCPGENNIDITYTLTFARSRDTKKHKNKGGGQSGGSIDKEL